MDLFSPADDVRQAPSWREIERLRLECSARFEAFLRRAIDGSTLDAVGPLTFGANLGYGFATFTILDFNFKLYKAGFDRESFELTVETQDLRPRLLGRFSNSSPGVTAHLLICIAGVLKIGPGMRQLA
jgi:hypothetical protein